jgi:outer membrane protein
MKPRPLVTTALLIGVVFPSAFADSGPSGSSKGKEARQSNVTVSSDFGTAAPRIRQLTGQITLAEAVNLALRQNPDVLRALREIERARGRVIEVRAQALPHLSLTSSYSEIDNRLTNSLAGPGNQGANSMQNMFTQNKTWRISLEVRQVLYSGGRVSASIEAEKLAQDALYFNLRDTLDKVVSQVRQQFSTVLATRGLIGVAQESVELASQQLRDATNRFEAGTVPKFNVLRAEVELASVRPGLIRAKNDYSIAQLQLAKTLGVNAAPDAKPSFECVGELQISYRTMPLVDAINLGRARRPSLKAQRQQILVEKERLTVARAGFKPQISVDGGVRKMSASSFGNSGGLSINDAVTGYFLGVNGSWNIFDGLETYGQVAQAKAKIESAIVTYEEAVLGVELEVQKSFAELQQYRETVESQQKNVEQAREALRLSQERLGAGAGTQLEVLDARVALTRARTIELQARADYVRSLAEFDRATATDTVYTEIFKDPLAVLEKKALHKAKAPNPSDLFKP